MKLASVDAHSFKGVESGLILCIEFPSGEGWQAKPDGVVPFETQNGEDGVAHLTNHPALTGTPP